MPALRAKAPRAAGAEPAVEPAADGGLIALHRVRFVPWSPKPVVAVAARCGAVLAAARDDGEIELWETGNWASLVVSCGRGVERGVSFLVLVEARTGVWLGGREWGGG